MSDDDATPARGDDEAGFENDRDPETTPEDVLERTRADAPLAAVVEKPRSETAIESLRAEGVYDDSRRVREDGPERVALPITKPPTETPVLEVVRQLEPEPRNPDLEDRLAARGWSEADLESVPGSWAVIGSVVVVTIPDDCPDERELGEALLEIHGEADSVLADEGIANGGEAGTFREPKTRHVAGERETETIHTEHGTRYGLDPSKVMFSPGNQAERARMGELVESGERVFDMFAGIGYFTLPMARAGAHVTATERNPTAVRYLLENAMLNGVETRVDVYVSDCRDLASNVEADRVVMGYYGSAADGVDDEGRSEDGQREVGHGTRTDEAHDFLSDALRALVPGGVVHYHEATPRSRLWERPLERLEAASEEASREFEVLEKRRVKSHSAGVDHVVVDARFE
ncbi:class I SAM-dependent methyltransferase [Natronorubrum daqingense]|uniref:tRNA(Phe) (4-demethylwyosine(37)-C(7)) aminocarboxypropyltransferase n=1 Tax=Natronorubrum daqingense TaxID=588898 RepID=A0A1N7ELT2_9EURY|nr:class I SAM-dependent methyltransferase family protein [Natronorubrum daqingense]APX97867.1 SAM-dependent methyltransferase [Natronorubrum daqingense]SIR89063.1 methyltransferase [Natronorubrum daqingense]